MFIRQPSDAIQKCMYNAHACCDASWFGCWHRKKKKIKHFMMTIEKWCLFNSFNFLPFDVVDAICNSVFSTSTSVPGCENAKTMQNHQIQWIFHICCYSSCCLLLVSAGVVIQVEQQKKMLFVAWHCHMNQSASLHTRARLHIFPNLISGTRIIRAPRKKNIEKKQNILRIKQQWKSTRK